MLNHYHDDHEACVSQCKIEDAAGSVTCRVTWRLDKKELCACVTE